MSWPVTRIARCSTAAFMLAVTALGSGQLGLGLLQLSAWSSMLVEYSRESSSLVKGIAMTFDGAHRCEMCRYVQEQAAAQKSHSDNNTPSRLELLPEIRLPHVLPTHFVYIPPNRQGQTLEMVSSTPLMRTELPEIPPPRV